MKRLVFIVLFLCSFAWAQKQPAPQPHTTKPAAKVEQASTEQILRLLDLLQVKDGLHLTLDAMKEQMTSGAEDMFREKVPNPTREQIKSVKEIVDEEFGGIPLDDMIKEVVPIYQKHLTRSDVAALIAFYSSPVGQKIRREQPAMARESMQATAATQRQKMELMLAKLDTRIQQLIDNEQNKTAPEKK